MAFAVSFGTDTKKRNSTKIPTLSASVQCLLKAGTSAENPTFILQGVGNLSPFSWNVASCTALGNRYYFVEDVRYFESTYEIVCSCDYLATYRAEILASTQFVARSASKCDYGLTDLRFPVQCQPVHSVTTNAFPVSASGSIIICTAGKSGNAYTSVTPSTFKALISYLYSAEYLESLNSFLEVPQDLQKEIAHPEEYLLSAIWLPIDVVGSPSAISLGYVSTGLSGGSVGTGEIRKITLPLAIPKHPTSENYAYRNVEPFSYYDLTLPYIGTTTISAKDLNGKTNVIATYSIDINGAISCEVTADTLHLFTASGNCGSPVGYSSRSTNIIGSMYSLTEGVSSFANLDIAGATSGVLSAVQNFAPHVQSSGGSGGTMTGNTTAYLKGTFYITDTIDNDRFGLPYCKPIQLSSLSGFCQCENASVPCSATENGKQTINNFLNGGVYIE